MKIILFLIFPIFFAGGRVAETVDSVLIQKIQLVPDLSAKIVNEHMPSVLLSSPNDERVERFASSKTGAFRFKTEGKETFFVVVNPNKSSGFLWWKKYDRLVITEKRWAELISADTLLSQSEQLFIQALP